MNEIVSICGLFIVGVLIGRQVARRANYRKQRRGKEWMIL